MRGFWRNHLPSFYPRTCAYTTYDIELQNFPYYIYDIHVKL